MSGVYWNALLVEVWLGVDDPITKEDRHLRGIFDNIPNYRSPLMKLYLESFIEGLLEKQSLLLESEFLMVNREVLTSSFSFWRKL